MDAGLASICQRFTASIGYTNMITFNVRLSRIQTRHPISMMSTSTTVTEGRSFQARRKPSDIMRISLVEFRMLSPS